MKQSLQRTLLAAALMLLGSITFGLAQQNSYVLSLDGAESFYVNDDSNDNLDLTGPYTFECWIRVDSYHQYDRIWDRRTVCEMSLYAPGGSGDFRFRYTERGSSHNILRSLVTTNDFSLDEWYHVAVTFDGSTARLYVNDNLEASEASSNWDLTSSTNALNIGGLYNSGYSNQIDAYIDEFRVSNIARAIGDMQTTTSDDEYVSDGNTVLLMHLDDQGDPPTYISGIDLSGTSGDDDITSGDYVNWNDAGFGGEDLPLPVDLSSFSVSYVNGKVNLLWKTASEMNNQGFIIERGLNENGAYKEIASYRTDDNLKGAGNSSTELKYNYVDGTVQKGRTYWYKLIDVDMNGVRREHGPVSVFVCINNFSKDEQRAVPDKFSLNQNYPNPFNPLTHITFDIPEFKGSNPNIELSIYDINGQKVRGLYSGYLEAGHYTYKWNGTNDNGLSLPSGTYIYQLKAANFVQSKKLVLMK